MEYLLICSITLFVSMVTLLSGFGLGTVLVPLFAIFFPIPLAISSVAVIHFLNNLFKMGLVGKFASRNVVLKFGIPAAISALAGAFLLSYIVQLPIVFSYQIYKLNMNVTMIGLIVGTIAIIASLFELLPRLSKLSVAPQYIPLGGVLSGFFGGLSGNQGIMRSAFLIKAGLNTRQYIGTCAVCSVIVDTVRIFVYGWAIRAQLFGQLQGVIWLLIAASLSAFAGSYIGSKLMHKITYKTLQIFVGSMLLVLGLGIILGV